MLQSIFPKSTQHLHQQSIFQYQLIKKIQKINRTIRMDLRTKSKFDNLLQSLLYQSQRRLRLQHQDSSALWLEALLMRLVKTPLVMIHLLLRLWPVCRFLQQRTLPTRKLGSPAWPQQLGRCSVTLDASLIQTSLNGIRTIERRPLPTRNSPLVIPWTLILTTLLFAMASGTKIVFEEIVIRQEPCLTNM